MVTVSSDVSSDDGFGFSFVGGEASFTIKHASALSSVKFAIIPTVKLSSHMA